MNCVVQNAVTLKVARWLLTTGRKLYREDWVCLKINVVKKSGNELKIEIVGGSHGLCNLLTKRLLEDKTVDFAGYDVPHPLASSPNIYLRMKGKTKPEEALLRAVEKVRGVNNSFAKELDRVLKA
jgi:DNA-directed RNA polymerase subunit L